IAAQQDAGPWPTATDLRHDPRHLLDRAGRAIDVGPPQPGRQQVAAAEDVERQIAIAVVVAVEEPALLVAVQWIVRRIEIESDLRRWPTMRLQEHLDEQRLDRRRVVAHLGMPGRGWAGPPPAGPAGPSPPAARNPPASPRVCQPAPPAPDRAAVHRGR